MRPTKLRSRIATWWARRNYGRHKLVAAITYLDRAPRNDMYWFRYFNENVQAMQLMLNLLPLGWAWRVKMEKLDQYAPTREEQN